MGKLSPTLYYTLVVALGGFIFGFDASVISGAIGFIDSAFSLTPWQQGFVVSSPTLGALLAMTVAGVVSDALGRRTTLLYIALLYLCSAIASALATHYTMLVVARFIGGMAFCSLVVAPVYISEISEPEHRGKMVSVNQLHIVLGFALSYFSNYFFLNLSESDAGWVASLGISSAPWRFMLGLEVVPALAWFILLFFVPESPRWLLLKGRDEQAKKVVNRLFSGDDAIKQLNAIMTSLNERSWHWREGARALFTPALRFPLLIGLILGISQQVTGINVIFFYAPTIFEQSGVGTNAAFMQAIWIGLVNIVFTLVAMYTIDRWGRKPLLITGLCGVALSMAVCTYGFSQAEFYLDRDAVAELAAIVPELAEALGPVSQIAFDSDIAFKQAVASAAGDAMFQQHEALLLSKSIDMNAPLVLFGIMAFVASFAMSLGPVMWTMLAEIFPNQSRALALSLVGVVNALASFLVQFVFPWELSQFGAAFTFAVYGVLALISLVLVIRLFPETKGLSLEQISKKLQ
ncbi:sugar porter family MFS transporter [Aestuariibacter sp. A3R04]|uniref:sugar porter family MFS transporter n=1 Tax=Aestuariibacter sp. A3R04 TaxID=2841571 RepID=UPI001C0A1CCC|nr:sugar porter family MFS transporter [Aestuariibacter sp. A3R04]MBU3020842.1 sugar porter family MFS transporter [Aestuariibacter sp. A3R04]